MCTTKLRSSVTCNQENNFEPGIRIQLNTCCVALLYLITLVSKRFRVLLGQYPRSNKAVCTTNIIFIAYQYKILTILTFKEFGLDERLLEGIDAMGYENATEVQEQVIPPIIAGKDIIASAQTGTGKTAAFLLPLIHKLITSHHEEHHINALIIVPTRELAIQIAQTMEGLSYFTSVSSIAVYGGGDGALLP